MKVSLSTGWKFDLFFSIKQSFEIAKKLKFDGIELVINSEYAFHKTSYIKRLSAKYDIPVLSIHCPLFAMPFLWPFKYWLDKTFRIADTLGAKLVVIHPPYLKTYGTKSGIKLLNYLTKKQKEFPNIKITLENFKRSRKNKKEYINHLEELHELLEKYDFKFTLDTTHLGYNKLDPIKSYKLFKKRTINIHFSDWANNHQHLTPGKGILPLTQFLEQLKNDNYQGNLTLELIFQPFVSYKKVYRETKKSINFIKRHYE